MKQVNGYLASDGEFFEAEDECKQYESQLERWCGIEERVGDIIHLCKMGERDKLPTRVREIFDLCTESDELVLSAILEGLMNSDRTNILKGYEIDDTLIRVRMFIDFILDGDG